MRKLLGVKMWSRFTPSKLLPEVPLASELTAAFDSSGTSLPKKPEV